MPIFTHPVDPERSWLWTRNGSRDIRAVEVLYTAEADITVNIEGISKARGQVLNNGGFRMPLADFENLCHAFLIHLDTERKKDWSQAAQDTLSVDAALRQNPDLRNFIKE